MEQSTIMIAAIIAIIVIYILSQRSTIEHFTFPAAGGWKQIPGALRNLTMGTFEVGKIALCGTNQGNQWWCVKDIDNPVWQRFDTTQDVLEVAIGPGRICVLDTANNIYCGK